MFYTSLSESDNWFGILEVSTDWKIDVSSLKILFELCYIFDGKCSRRLNDEKEDTLSSGMYCLTEPGSKIKYFPDKTSDFSMIRIFFPAEFLDHALKNCVSLPDLAMSPLMRFKHLLSPAFSEQSIFTDTDSSIGTLFKHALTEFQNTVPGYREFIRCFILEIILHMMRQQVNYNQHILYDKYLRTIQLYCTEHYAEDITLKELADKMHYSLPYLSNKFKQLTGSNFKTFLQSIRVSEACHFLVFTKKTVAEIASSVGYSDTRSFVQVFKKHTNMTPSQFRKQNANPPL